MKLSCDKSPLVSIGIPTYNRPKLLRRALQSALCQTYQRIEIIISDNNSPDPEVAEIIDEVKNYDSRVISHKFTSNVGAVANFELLLSKASGEYFMWLADDDEISKNYVEILSTTLIADPTASLAVGAIKGRHFRTEEINENPQLTTIGTGRDLFLRLKTFLSAPESSGKGALLYGLHRTASLRDDWSKTRTEFAGSDIYLVFLSLLRGSIVYRPEADFFLEWGIERDYSHREVGSFLRGLVATSNDIRQRIANAPLTADQKTELMAEVALREAAWISSGWVETNGLKSSVDDFLAGAVVAAKRRCAPTPRRPFMSVIVPTRNRPQTLSYTLRTIVDQQYDDYEIIISDNGLADTARSVVDDIQSDRVRYVRPDRSLSMTAHWNFAIEQAKGEHLLLLGDDDGLLPGAIRELAQAHNASNEPVLRWERLYYHWPDIFPSADANQWRVFLTYGWTETCESQQAIQNVIDGSWSYTRLPMLYNASIRRDIVDQIRLKTGRVFHGLCPDITSGFIIAMTAGRYRSVDSPMTISGSSGNSNGATISKQGLESKIARDFISLNKQDGIDWASQSPKLFSVLGGVLDSLFTAQNALATDMVVNIDRIGMARRLAMSAIYHPAYQGEGRVVLADELARFVGNRTVAEEIIGLAGSVAVSGSLQWREGFKGEVVDLDASRFGALDVAGAANLYGRVEAVLRGLVKIGRSSLHEQIVMNVLSLLALPIQSSSRAVWMRRLFDALPIRQRYNDLIDRNSVTYSKGGIAALELVNHKPPQYRIDGRLEFRINEGQTLSFQGWALESNRRDVSRLLFLSAIETSSGTETLFMLFRQPNADVGAQFGFADNVPVGFSANDLVNRLRQGSYNIRFYQADLSSVSIAERSNIQNDPVLVVT